MPIYLQVSALQYYKEHEHLSLRIDNRAFTEHLTSARTSKDE